MMAAIICPPIARLIGPLHILVQGLLTACEPYTSRYFLTRGRQRGVHRE